MGKVFLLGAGLGTKNYLTVRGWEILQRAEVVIYDALGSQELLDLLPRTVYGYSSVSEAAKRVRPKKKLIAFWLSMDNRQNGWCA